MSCHRADLVLSKSTKESEQPVQAPEPCAVSSLTASVLHCSNYLCLGQNVLQKEIAVNSVIMSQSVLLHLGDRHWFLSLFHLVQELYYVQLKNAF